MSQSRHPGGPRRSPPLTLERFRQLLEAYGAAPGRWPDGEREAAERLLAQSSAARTLCEDAADLDRLLDTVTPAPPSPALAMRVLAAAPRPVRRWRRVLVAAVPLAAAAAVTLWLTVDREPQRRVADATVAQVGEYTSPTDVLLESYAVDVSSTVPSVGCSDSVLGCPDVDTTAQPYSRRGLPRRSLA